MGKRKFPFVQTRKLKTCTTYRGYASIDGVLTWGLSRATPEEAYQDALKLRKNLKVTGIVTLKHAADAVLEDTFRTKKIGTYNFYVYHLNTIYRFLNQDADIRLLTSAVLKQFQKDRLKEAGTSTLGLHRVILRKVCRHAVKQGWLEKDPTQQVTWPAREHRDPHYFEKEALEKVFAKIASKSTHRKPWDYLEQQHDIVVLMFYAGLRRAEMARLKKSDIDLQARILWVDGKRRRETITILKPAHEFIQRLIEKTAPREFLIPGGTETQRTEVIRHMFRWWQLELPDKKFHPHTLRHSLATGLLKAGIDMRIIQRHLRHKSYAMTERYQHLVGADVQKSIDQIEF